MKYSKQFMQDQMDAMNFIDSMNLPDYLKKIPMTASGGASFGKILYPTLKVLRFVNEQRKKPWHFHLVLGSFVLAASGFKSNSVGVYVRTLDRLFSNFLRKTDYTERDLYGTSLIFTGEMINSIMENVIEAVGETDNEKKEFHTKFRGFSSKVSDWFHINSKVLGFQRESYQRLLIPEITSYKVIVLMKKISQQCEKQAQAKRKEDTDTVIQNFRKIAIGSRKRMNTFDRFYLATIVAEKEAIDKRQLIYDYSFVEHDRVVKLRLVHVIALAGIAKEAKAGIAKEGKYSRKFSLSVKAAEGLPLAYESKYYYVELVDVDNDSPLWFADMAAHAVLNTTLNFTKTKRSNYLKKHNYTDGHFTFSYLRRCKYEGVSRGFVEGVGVLTNRIFVSPHELRLQLYIGALALDFMVNSGARINEVMQISADPKCLNVVHFTAASGKVMERAIVMLTPKGSDEPTAFFVTSHTLELIFKTYAVIADNYRIFDGDDSVPSVSPNKLNRKYDHLPDSPFVFQVNGVHLNSFALMTAVRVLVHGVNMKFIGEDGRLKNLVLTSHVIRHAFATFAVQVQRVPLDVAAKMLNHKNLMVTGYYSSATPSIIWEHHLAITDALFDSVDLDELAARSSKEIQDAYKDALHKSGAFTEVLGGTCVFNGHCPAKMSCIGCESKIPDPLKRDAIERKLEWARDELGYNQENGLGAEVRKCEVLINNCLNELSDIEEIEQYQAESKAIAKIFDSHTTPLKLAGASYERPHS